jgi:multidrug efflux pump
VSRFFIDRPIFASVLSIIITLAGGLAVFTLPIAQYPEITPPTVEVSAFYPGANAKVVADTVAARIEQQVNGVENMLYMSSQCTNDGMYTLTVTFKNGVDLNMAQVLVQNRESLADPILPDLVKRRGVAVKKKSPSILMIINVFSPDETRDNLYLSTSRSGRVVSSYGPPSSDGSLVAGVARRGLSWEKRCSSSSGGASPLLLDD